MVEGEIEKSTLKPLKNQGFVYNFRLLYMFVSVYFSYILILYYYMLTIFFNASASKCVFSFSIIRLRILSLLYFAIRYILFFIFLIFFVIFSQCINYTSGYVMFKKLLSFLCFLLSHA